MIAIWIIVFIVKINVSVNNILQRNRKNLKENLIRQYFLWIRILKITDNLSHYHPPKNPIMWLIILHLSLKEILINLLLHLNNFLRTKSLHLALGEQLVSGTDKNIGSILPKAWWNIFRWVGDENQINHLVLEFHQ